MAGWILGAIAILLLWALIARARTYGRLLSDGALDFFLSFALLSLGLPITKARLWIGAGNVHHAQLQLSSEEQAAVVAKPPLDTSDASLFALRAQASEARTRA